MAIAITSVGTSKVGNDGGYELVIDGSGFPLNTPLSVYIGSAGDATDKKATSGVPGLGYSPRAISATRVKVYTPELVVGGPYKVTVTDGVTTATLAAAVTVIACDFKSKVFSMRSILPPIYSMGPRSIVNLDPLP